MTGTIWHIPNAQEAFKTQLWNNKLVSGKGPKLGFEYLPTYKTLHCGQGILYILKIGRTGGGIFKTY